MLAEPGSGKEVSVGEFAGADVVMLVSTVGCPVCRRQIAELKTIHRQYSDKGVKFINAVIAEADDFGKRSLPPEDSLARYGNETGIPFPVYLDVPNALADSYDVKKVPVLAFITREGGLALTRPFTYWRDVSNILDALIAGKEIDTSGMDTKPG